MRYCIKKAWRYERGNEAVDTNNRNFIADRNGDRCHNVNQDVGYEICVCCHKKVKILKNKDIELRSFYIEGAGQLCYDCYHELYSQFNR